MSELKTCDTCKGRKQLTGLGSMLVDCHGCKGIGYITFTNTTNIPIIDITHGSMTVDEHKLDIVSDPKSNLKDFQTVIKDRLGKKIQVKRVNNRSKRMVTNE